MSLPATSFDIIIIGGGPAGSCAALRLLSMGYKVALIEQKTFPRNQIGESLSPAVKNVFNYLGAEHLLLNKDYIHDLPSRIIWETSREESYRKTGNIIVDRSSLDANLIALGESKGLQVFQPAKYISANYLSNRWQLNITTCGSLQSLNAAFVLDARGRCGTGKSDRIKLGLSNIALWTNVSSTRMLQETMVEALEDGWIWASPVCNQQFRVMAFCDKEYLKNKPADKAFYLLVAQSQLLKTFSQITDQPKVHTCLVNQYVHFQPWFNGYLKLGESAFTLDPLSSSGVEKVMRFSLQAAIAVNTSLAKGNVELAKSFFEHQLIASVVNHTKWTSKFYSNAWPGRSSPFWEKRSIYSIELANGNNDFYNKLIDAFNKPDSYNTGRGTVTGVTWEMVDKVWDLRIKRSPKLNYVNSICVIGDLLEERTAVDHPNFQGGLAFLNNIDIIPLLKKADTAETFGDMIKMWEANMSSEQAIRIAIYLCSHEVLCLS